MGVILAGDASQGLATAVAATVDVTAPPVARAEQLPLLPSEQIDLLPLEARARHQALQQPRRAGRPPGAINRSTKAWREFLLAKHRSPLEVLAETYSRPVQDLAAELGCTKLEAFQLQQRAAAELAPYLHGKMPIEVEINANGVVQLVLETPLGGAMPVGTGSILDGATIVEYQQVSEGSDDEV